MSLDLVVIPVVTFLDYLVPNDDADQRTTNSQRYRGALIDI